MSLKLCWTPIFVGMIIISLLTQNLTPLAAAQQEPSIANLFAQQADSIVLIMAKVNNRKGSLGTGFIVSPNGLIVTNYHVIKKAKKIAVKLRNEKTYSQVTIIAFDQKKDIALIKIEGNKLKPVTLGNSERVVPGEKVVAIGNPLGLESTVTDGLVSSVRHLEKGSELLQISVPLSEGSSGGPLFNLKGEVIGITTASLIKGQSLNFAIPINQLRPLLEKYSFAKKIKKKRKEKLVNQKYQEIRKSQVPLSLPKEDQFITYTVQKNDTLYRLAQEYHTTVEDIRQANGLLAPTIFPGQKIRIPRTLSSR